MKAQVRNFISWLGDTFWIVPGAMVMAGILLALGLVAIDRSGLVARWLLESAWLYNGGGTGARTLLGAVASSTIGVAGTVFSITIAALSLAAGQMGPRLLRNFTKDRGNQVTLGAFLGTFAYALMVLRSVRTQDEGVFVPHVALTVSIALAILCVGTLVFFVNHMAGRINVETVIDLVSRDVSAALERQTGSRDVVPAPPVSLWRHAAPVTAKRRGYLQQLDEEGLADWADAKGAQIRLLVRPGEYVFPGAPVALVSPPVEDAGAAFERATACGGERVSDADLEFALRQLVEVAVRALSPGINDPQTAIGVLDRLGGALCDVAGVELPCGVILRKNIPVLVVPAIDYDGLTDTMFHMIRENAASSPAVLIRMLEVLTAVAACEVRPGRQSTLQRHADLVLGDGERGIANPSDVEDLRKRHHRFVLMRQGGPFAVLADQAT